VKRWFVIERASHSVCLALGFPVTLVTDGTDDVAKDLGRSRHGAEPPPRRLPRRYWNNLSERLSAASDADGLTCPAHLRQDAKALGLEFRNRDFLHGMPFSSKPTK
jgi:hypothetical protein